MDATARVYPGGAMIPYPLRRQFRESISAVRLSTAFRGTGLKDVEGIIAPRGQAPVVASVRTAQV